LLRGKDTLVAGFFAGRVVGPEGLNVFLGFDDNRYKWEGNKGQQERILVELHSEPSSSIAKRTKQ
jgi:hypothetical protein